jgi:hypothetical protein
MKFLGLIHSHFHENVVSILNENRIVFLPDLLVEIGLSSKDEACLQNHLNISFSFLYYEQKKIPKLLYILVNEVRDYKSYIDPFGESHEEESVTMKIENNPSFQRKYLKGEKRQGSVYILLREKELSMEKNYTILYILVYLLKLATLSTEL